MLGGDPPAMRSALQLLVAGLLLLGSLPCRGVGASSSPPPTTPPIGTAAKPTSGALPSAELPTHVTSRKPVSSPRGLTTLKPTTLPPPPAPSSPGPAEPPRTPAVEVSLKTTSAPTPGGGAPTAPVPPLSAVPVRTTPKGPALTPVTSPTSRTSPEGAVSKDLTSSSRTSTSSLSPTSPSVPRPVGSTAKSPGASSLPTNISPGLAVVSGAVTPESPTARKDVTTNKDKVAPASSTLAPGHSKMPDQIATTGAIIPTGVARGTPTRSSTGGLSSPPDLKTKPSVAPSTTAIPQEHHSPPPASGANRTSPQVESKIVCEKTMPLSDDMILLILNKSRPCNSLEGSVLKEVLLGTLCKAVKPNFNQSRDECTVRLASDREEPSKLAVVGVSVQTNSVDEELAEALAAKRAELEKLGVHNITHRGRPLDAEPKDHLSLPLIITIICMAASLLLVAAIYGCCHQRISHRKDQQRLTEELHTIENGYHDNPTLEVTEISSEMQEKKINLNGELGDSWIVPMDSLTKDDLDEEEDTHL